MANNTLVGALRAEATLESGKFVDGARKVQSEARKLEGTVKKSFDGAGAAIKGFGGALTAGLSIGVLTGLATKALAFATAIKDTAAQVGATTKELQLFQYAAGQVGIKQGEVEKGLEKLNASMGKAASGSTTSAKAFAAVGVSLEDIKTKSKTEIFGQIADQMIKQGGAAKNAAAANAIFGEGAAKLFPLLDQGSAGMNELSQAAERLGVVLSDQAIQSADETARKLDDVKRVLAAQIAGVVAENASSIVTLANALGQLTSAVIGFLSSNPQLALGLLGAMAGSRFGIAGAGAGFAAGAIAGGVIGRGRADANTNLDARLKAYRDAKGRLGELKSGKPKSNALISFGRSDARPANTLKAAEAEFARQRGLLQNAVNAAKAARSQPTAVPIDLPQFLAPAPKAGPKARKPRAGPKPPRDRSDDVAYQFSQELLSAEADVLRAQRDLATSTDERAKISIALLNIQQQQQQAELDNRVRRAERDFAEGRITEQTLEEVKAHAGTLSAQYAKKNALERQALDEEIAAQKARDELELSQSAYDIEIELLQNQGALARTANEKRDVELRILAVMKEQERARLEAVIADKQSSELAKAEAQQRLDALDGIYAGRQKQAVQGTQGPLEGYFSQLPKDAAELTQALEEVQVRGLQGIEEGLMAVITGAKSMKDAFTEIVNSIIQDLLRLAIQKYVVGALGQALGLTGAAVPGIFGGGMSASSNAIAIGNAAVPGMARGGSGVFGGRAGTDRNVLSLNGLPIARVSKGERFSVSNDNGGAGIRVEVVKGDLFDVIVRHHAGDVAAPMAAHAAIGGAQGAQMSLARRQRNTLR